MATATTRNGSGAVLIDTSGWLESDEKAVLFAPSFESK